MRTLCACHQNRRKRSALLFSRDRFERHAHGRREYHDHDDKGQKPTHHVNGEIGRGGKIVPFAGKNVEFICKHLFISVHDADKQIIKRRAFTVAGTVINRHGRRSLVRSRIVYRNRIIEVGRKYNKRRYFPVLYFLFRGFDIIRVFNGNRHIIRFIHRRLYHIDCRRFARKEHLKIVLRLVVRKRTNQ